MTKEQAISRASTHYLTTQIPEEFFGWDEEKQNTFLNAHAWEPFKDYPPEDIYEYIDNLALDMMKIARGDILKSVRWKDHLYDC